MSWGCDLTLRETNDTSHPSQLEGLAIFALQAKTISGILHRQDVALHSKKSPAVRKSASNIPNVSRYWILVDECALVISKYVNAGISVVHLSYAGRSIRHPRPSSLG